MQTNIYSLSRVIQRNALSRYDERDPKNTCSGAHALTHFPQLSHQTYDRQVIILLTKQKNKTPIQHHYKLFHLMVLSGLKNEERSLSAAAFKERQQAQHQFVLCLRL